MLGLERSDAGLYFQDQDTFQILLVEVDEMISAENATKHTDIPIEKQIIRILGMDWHVTDPEKSTQFQQEFLEIESDGFSKVIPSVSDEKTRMGRGSLDHLAYRVGTKEEVEQWRKRLWMLV